LKTPKTLIPVALFALSFTGSVFVLRQPGRALPSLMHVVPEAPVVSTEIGVVPPVARAPDPPLVTPGASSDVQPPIEPISEAIDTLENSLSPDDRVRAIRSLAANARDGIEVTRVRASLRLAATDEDPDVAARAQEEYEGHVEREDR
jgi:hypothetical protein